LATQRLDLRDSPNGYWTVHGVFTGMLVIVRDVIIDRLIAEKADIWLNLLNLKDARRRGAEASLKLALPKRVGHETFLVVRGWYSARLRHYTHFMRNPRSWRYSPTF
jgi:hypothetical protein